MESGASQMESGASQYSSSAVNEKRVADRRFTIDGQREYLVQSDNKTFSWVDTNDGSAFGEIIKRYEKRLHKDYCNNTVELEKERLNDKVIEAFSLSDDFKQLLEDPDVEQILYLVKIWSEHKQKVYYKFGHASIRSQQGPLDARDFSKRLREHSIKYGCYVGSCEGNLEIMACTICPNSITHEEYIKEMLKENLGLDGIVSNPTWDNCYWKELYPCNYNTYIAIIDLMRERGEEYGGGTIVTEFE